MIKKIHPLQILVVLVVLVPILLFSFWKNTYPEKITLKNSVFNIEVADTSILMEKGLSGRPGLASNEGMLFEFSDSGKHEFWMKGMKFPIDIIWFNADRQIVHIESSISPDTFPKTFTSEVDSQYVLEISAGQSSKLGLKIGDQFDFVEKAERKL